MNKFGILGEPNLRIPMNGTRHDAMRQTRHRRHAVNVTHAPRRM